MIWRPFFSDAQGYSVNPAVGMWLCDGLFSNPMVFRNRLFSSFFAGQFGELPILQTKGPHDDPRTIAKLRQKVNYIWFSDIDL